MAPPTEMLLALNCGSSSIKFKLFKLKDLSVLIEGSASQVNSKGQKPTIKLVVHHADKSPDETENEEEEEGMEYDAVFQRTIELIEQSESKHFSSSSDDDPVRARDVIKLISHRVVHGGGETEPMAIWPGHEEGLEKLDKLSEFAPLHNHRAVQVVKSCLQHLPESRQILLFDTLFHQSLPEHIYTYPVAPPPEPSPIPLRKYGAHGLSYASVLTSVSKRIKKPASETSIVVAHLGSGASICAIKHGKSFDTSMGLTPLDGLPGGTRSGSVDPVFIFHHTPHASEIVDFKGTTLSRGEMLLNKDAGLAALTGTSDFRTITMRAKGTAGSDVPAEDTKSSKLAYDLFLDRVVNYVSSYVVKILGAPSHLSGSASAESHLDGIVFSGGIGEKSVDLRRDVIGYFKWLGVEIDERANESAGKGSVEETVFEISAKNSRIRVFMCLTDEETQCAIMAKEFEKEE